MTGYSGSVASTWQQAGRAGRRSCRLVVLVATSAPLDQYIMGHPDYFFEQAPESATVDPNNLIIISSHIKCAAFELPFKEGESFGLDPASTAEILDYLADERVLRKAGNKWHWSADAYPAEDVSLRTAAPGNVVILDTTRHGHVIGEVDLFAAPVEVYQNAIYLHQSVQYTIDELDLDDRKAYARPVESDYYTDAQIKVDLKVLERFRDEAAEERHQKRRRSQRHLAAQHLQKDQIRHPRKRRLGRDQSPRIDHAHFRVLDRVSRRRRRAPRHGPTRTRRSLARPSNTLRQVAPVQVLCDPTDIRALAMQRAPFSEKPTVYLYESYPGGVGASDKLFDHHNRMLEAVVSLISGCQCPEGCPSCVGPALDAGEHAKPGAVKLARWALGLPLAEALPKAQ
jgi:DEAD/DEAH box helicase domain-containing protein